MSEEKKEQKTAAQIHQEYLDSHKEQDAFDLEQKKKAWKLWFPGEPFHFYGN